MVPYQIFVSTLSYAAQYPTAMTQMTIEQVLEALQQAATGDSKGSRSGSGSALDRLQGLLGSDAVLVEVPGGDGPEGLEGQVVDLVGGLRDFGVDVHSDVQVSGKFLEEGKSRGMQGNDARQMVVRLHPFIYVSNRGVLLWGSSCV